MSDPVIVWLRQDLRLADQPAFVAAAHDGPVIPLYVLDDDGPGDYRMGGASRWWLHHSLTTLAADLEERGSRLVLRRGPAAEVVAEVAKQAGVSAVHAVRHFEPWWRDAEHALAKTLDLQLHDANQLAPPEDIKTGGGKPFKIYTPYWRELSKHMPPPDPAQRPRKLDTPSKWPKSDTLASWALLPTKPDWSTGFSDWEPGEAGAHKALAAFAKHAGRYEQERNFPAVEGTSRLSPHLHFGEVSPRQVWHATADAGGSVRTFQGEVAWRDYAQNIMGQYPSIGTDNVRPAFDKLKWRTGKQAEADLKAWQKGETGYPIVDAGMRQLWQSGWMHNRLRLITSSFLVKHLLIDWREGAKWFWDCLVCADYGNNSVNWQWTSGSGVDSNMFSRIMAPLTQSAKFDAADYIREWVPELADLSDDVIHDPDETGCRPKGYPEKIVGHKEARDRALAAYAKIKD